MPVSQDFNSRISVSIRGDEVTCCEENGLPVRRQSYTVNHNPEDHLGAFGSHSKQFLILHLSKKVEVRGT